MLHKEPDKLEIIYLSGADLENDITSLFRKRRVENHDSEAVELYDSKPRTK